MHPLLLLLHQAKSYVVVLYARRYTAPHDKLPNTQFAGARYERAARLLSQRPHISKQCRPPKGNDLQHNSYSHGNHPSHHETARQHTTKAAQQRKAGSAARGLELIYEAFVALEGSDQPGNRLLPKEKGRLGTSPVGLEGMTYYST